MSCSHPNGVRIEAAYGAVPDLSYSGIWVGRELVKNADWCPQCGALQFDGAWHNSEWGIDKFEDMEPWEDDPPDEPEP